MKKNSRPTLQLISRISWCGCESVKRFSDGVNQSLNTSLNLLYYWSATIYANRHYLSIYHRTHGERLAVNAPEKPKIIGDVLIHPLAVVHPTATVSVYTVVICHSNRNWQLSLWKPQEVRQIETGLEKCG